jgi:hypothetical protein
MTQLITTRAQCGGALLVPVQAAEVVKPVAEKKPEEHAHWVDPVEVATLLSGHDVHELEPAVAVNVLTAHTGPPGRRQRRRDVHQHTVRHTRRARHTGAKTGRAGRASGARAACCEGHAGVVSLRVYGICLRWP